MKIGVIGIGRIGKLHCENIRRFFPTIELKTIVDLEVDKLKSWAAQWQIPCISTNPDEIFRDPEINAVLICSSTDSHLRFIQDAARAQKAIFCEKPLDYNLDRIKEVLNLVNKHQIPLMVGFNRRFDPNFRRAWQLRKDNALGTIHIVKITSRDPAPPPISYIQKSGGLFYDMTIHDWDMARYMAGDEVEEVYALGDALIDPLIKTQGNDIDTAVAVLKFKKGTMAIIDNSRQAKYGYDQRVELFGTKGAVVVENNPVTSARVFTENGMQTDKIPYFFLERYQQSYIAELQEFFTAITEHRQPAITGQDGLQAVVVAATAMKSLREHRPVRCDEIL